MALDDGAVQALTISYRAAAQLLGVDKRVVRGLVADGRIRYSRLGTRVVLNRTDVLRLAEGQANRTRRS